MSELPAGWVETNIGAIRRDESRSVDPRLNPSTEFDLFSVPSLATGNPEVVAGVEIGSTKKTLAPGTVVISKINPKLNRVWLIPAATNRPQIGSSEWIVCSPTSAVIPSYLAHFLRHTAVRDYLAANVSGVGGSLMRVTPTVLDRFPLPLPPLPEQHRIVAAIEQQFSRLDAGVASLRRAKRNLGRMRASILSAAVEGRLVAREGEWTTTTIGALAASIDYGSSAKASAEVPGGVPMLRMGNIVNGALDYQNLKYLPADHPETTKFALAPGDLLFNRTNSPELVGKSAVFRGYSGGATFASYLVRVRFTDAVNPAFVAAYINSAAGREYIASVRSQQVGQANVNASKLAAMPIPLPSCSEQGQIASEVDRQFSILDAMESTVDAGLARAERLRQAILREAFAGRLVPQDPADEPASALLARIEAARVKA